MSKKKTLFPQARGVLSDILRCLKVTSTKSKHHLKRTRRHEREISINISESDSASDDDSVAYELPLIRNIKVKI
jgi:hypothetical protein